MPELPEIELYLHTLRPALPRILSEDWPRTLEELEELKKARQPD